MNEERFIINGDPADLERLLDAMSSHFSCSIEEHAVYIEGDEMYSSSTDMGLCEEFASLCEYAAGFMEGCRVTREAAE